MKDRTNKFPILNLILGIIIYPLGLWWIVIPSNVLRELNILFLWYICSSIAYCIAVTFFILTFVFRSKNKGSVLLWAGFGLHSLFISLPVILFIIIFIAVVFFGASV